MIILIYKFVVNHVNFKNIVNDFNIYNNLLVMAIKQMKAAKNVIFHV